MMSLSFNLCCTLWVTNDSTRQTSRDELLGLSRAFSSEAFRSTTTSHAKWTIKFTRTRFIRRLDQQLDSARGLQLPSLNSLWHKLIRRRRRASLHLRTCLVVQFSCWRLHNDVGRNRKEWWKHVLTNIKLKNIRKIQLSLGGTNRAEAFAGERRTTARGIMKFLFWLISVKWFENKH